MRYNGVKLRHEMKFYISWGEYELLRARLSPVLKLDENTDSSGGYHIRSLYFDDMYDTAMFSKLSGEQRRDKYRIRIYNITDKSIKFEKKSKYDAFIAKTSASITKDMFYEMMEGDYSSLLKSGNKLLLDIYAKRSTVLLRPAVIVDYLREAYVYEQGNVRITFDKHVRAGYDSFDIFSKDVETSPVVDADQLVLEIKYDDFLPTVVQEIVRPIKGNISAISKYVMCRQRFSEIRTVSRRVVLPANGY